MGRITDLKVCSLENQLRYIHKTYVDNLFTKSSKYDLAHKHLNICDLYTNGRIG